MAIIHLSGTKLAPKKLKAPLNRQFMYAIGCIFLVAMHLYFPNLYRSGFILPFNAFVWGVLSLVVSLGCFQIATHKQVRYSKLTIVLFVCCLIITIPIFYSNQSYWFNVAPRLLVLWCGWLFFAVLQQFNLSNQHKQRLLWFIVLASILQVITGYIQFFDLMPKAIFGNTEYTTLPFGVFLHESVMVSFLSTGLVVSGYLLARQQRKYGQKVSRTFILYATPLIVIPLIILISQDLEWVGAAVGFLFIATYLYRFSTSQRLSGWIASSITGVGLGLILFSNYTIEDPSADHQIDRAIIYPQAVDMMIEKPFTGYGYGRFESEYLLYTARQHQLNSNYPVGYSSAKHPLNEILYWGVEGGIVPIIGIFLAALMVLYKIYSARKGTRLAILSLFIPIIIHSQIGMPFYLSSVHWLTFIILLYWVDQRSSKHWNYSISKLNQRMSRVFRFAIPIATSIYMLAALQTNYTLVKFDRSYPKDPTILNGAINPISEKQEYEWEKYRSLLNIGLVNQEVKPIQEYIQWSVETIKHSPKEKYYSNLILAYLGLGEISKANQIRSEASFLFPLYDFSVIDIEAIVQPELVVNQKVDAQVLD